MHFTRFEHFLFFYIYVGIDQICFPLREATKSELFVLLVCLFVFVLVVVGSAMFRAPRHPLLFSAIFRVPWHPKLTRGCRQPESYRKYVYKTENETTCERQDKAKGTRNLWIH